MRRKAPSGQSRIVAARVVATDHRAHVRMHERARRTERTLQHAGWSWSWMLVAWRKKRRIAPQQMR